MRVVHAAAPMNKAKCNYEICMLIEFMANQRGGRFVSVGTASKSTCKFALRATAGDSKGVAA